MITITARTISHVLFTPLSLALPFRLDSKVCVAWMPVNTKLPTIATPMTPPASQRSWVWSSSPVIATRSQVSKATRPGMNRDRPSAQLGGSGAGCRYEVEDLLCEPLEHEEPDHESNARREDGDLD